MLCEAELEGCSQQAVRNNVRVAQDGGREVGVLGDRQHAMVLGHHFHIQAVLRSNGCLCGLPRTHLSGRACALQSRAQEQRLGGGAPQHPGSAGWGR